MAPLPTVRALSVLLPLTCGFSINSASLDQLYHTARQIRIREGHTNAQPVYDEILRRNPADLTASTRIAASTGATLRHLQNACHGGFDKDADSTRRFADLRSWFVTSNFTAAAVEDMLRIATPASSYSGTLDSHASAPIYITPAAAGSVIQFPFASASITACQCLVALFLLGLTVPVATALLCCSEHHIQLLQDVGLICVCDHNPSLLLPLVSIMPIDLFGDGPRSTQTLFVVTDWHPRVLNTIRMFDEGSASSAPTYEEAVMYIGPDSLGLLQHWILHPNLPSVHTLLDVCTGSGVQALATLAVGKCKTAICLDINMRALRFASFSAQLNGYADSMVFVHGNVLTGKGHVISGSSHRLQRPDSSCLLDLLQNLPMSVPSSVKIGMITCNPPFLPIPDSGNSYSSFTQNVAAKHGWFSAGGASGEEILAAVLRMARSVLSDGGMIAIVSEFFFARDDTSGSLEINRLLDRLGCYWTDGEVPPCADNTRTARALLLTNEFPISATSYAQRRADSKDEVNEWIQHLGHVNIAACSPGFFYVQKNPGSDCWTHRAVPKSNLGSLWTPGNTYAVDFTRTATKTFFDITAE